MTSVNLDSLSFPLYGIQAINNEYFVCAGGGGAAKTGVRNAIHIYQLKKSGKTYEATNICDVDTGKRAVMNLDVNPSRDTLAIGVDHLCKFYKINYIKEKGKEIITLKEINSIETVTTPDNGREDEGEYQKYVRFTPDEKHVITGASDGSCRIYKYPSLELRHEIKKAHGDEIDELDVHPNSKLFVTVSKDSTASLWKIAEGKKQLELPFSLDKKDEDFYKFRNCRFSLNKDTNTVYLFTTNIPKKFIKNNPTNCLVKWSTNKWLPEQTVFIKNQTLSALNVSSHGRYLGVGTADGSILVYISWNMKHLKTIKNVHDIFVTGLSFLPENKELCEDMKQDAAILSCSIDNNCQMTMIPSRFELPFGIFAFFFICVIIMAFNIITYFDVEF